MNVAFVYDRVNKWGGAERVLLALHDIWPDAPLFTAVYDPNRASWARVFRVQPSFLQYMPFAKRHHEWYPWLTPMAFESFSFDAFDLVISVTSAEAKNIITKPDTVHICYCLTPTRYLWNEHTLYAKHSRWLEYLAPTLRRWDRLASQRPDYYIAISDRVKERIETYYGREVETVIYPPVEISKGLALPKTRPQGEALRKQEYFLVVSRLVPYKRIDIIIEAFNSLGWQLVIIGDGTERKKLQHMAKTNITFITRHLTDKELVGYYQGCRACVFAADEDFGIAAVEALACGAPVVTYRGSGISEIITTGKTGMEFAGLSADALQKALVDFSRQSYDPQDCRARATRFDQLVFAKRMKQTVEKLYNTCNI
ncbi:glycosyltransferase [Candidatus Gottesmanbacteria bacterium]|nr:glycosyltransferase [Candidatus Gottesmanbacteria bacterium]